MLDGESCTGNRLALVSMEAERGWAVPTNKIRFGFGKNWKSFVAEALDDTRISVAMKSLQRQLLGGDLQGKTFLDMGCGSGLFSLAACLLGAERVIAFDYDLESVETSLTLREKASVAAEKWEVLQGSVLDTEFLSTLTPVDVVYAWGVLHHTGAMWVALSNASDLVKPGGVLGIGIYNKVERRFGGSSMWWQIKRTYNRSPGVVRRLMEFGYGSILMLRKTLILRNPLRAIREYSELTGRGMDFWHDARDWLGGFPYEFAAAGEVFNYVHRKHGLELIYLKTQSGNGCNEFTFRRPDSVER